MIDDRRSTGPFQNDTSLSTPTSIVFIHPIPIKRSGAESSNSFARAPRIAATICLIRFERSGPSGFISPNPHFKFGLGRRSWRHCRMTAIFRQRIAGIDPARMTMSVRDAGEFVGQFGGLAGARPPLLPTPSSHMQLLALQINKMQQCGHMGAINRLNLKLFLPQGAMPALGEGRAPCLGRRPISGRTANFPYPDDRPRPHFGPSLPSARSHPCPRPHFPVQSGIGGGSRALSLGRGASLEGWPIFHIRMIGPVLVSVRPR